jgi:protein-tyrosine phosphatase
VIDLHAHVLPGIDDGPPDMDAAVALAGAAAHLGVGAVVATPHVSWDWPNTAHTIALAVRQLVAELAVRRIELRIHAGAEVALTFAFELTDAELQRLRLGAGPWLLVEAPHTSGSVAVGSMLEALQRRGHRIVLAHVERCPAFHEDTALLGRLVRAGMLASITAGSLSGRFGRPARRAAERFIADGLVHNVSSDAHDTRSRPPGLRGDLTSAGLSDRASWLTHEVPSAILRGSPIPPAPALPPAPARRRSMPSPWR